MECDTSTILNVKDGFLAGCNYPFWGQSELLILVIGTHSYYLLLMQTLGTADDVFSNWVLLPMKEMWTELLAPGFAYFREWVSIMVFHSLPFVHPSPPFFFIPFSPYSVPLPFSLSNTQISFLKNNMWKGCADYMQISWHFIEGTWAFKDYVVYIGSWNHSWRDI